MVCGRVVALCACCVVVPCGCGGTAAHPKEIVIDRDSKLGKHASAEASGESGRVDKLWVRVRASPNQRVTGSWTVACRSGTATSRDADNFGGRTPLTIPLPDISFPDGVCTFVGDASLAGSGRVTVELLAR
jgi:hypothetical protein